MIKNVEMFLEFKEYIPKPPQAAQDMYKQACSNDSVTINSWRPKWIANAKACKERFGSFKENGIGQIFHSNKHKPCIVVGSGPSLAGNIDELAKIKDMAIVSCLHNFHYMVDNDVKVDYYVSLDAGPVVIDEMFEGGSKTPAEYIEATKDKTLLAFIGSHPSLWENWKGRVLLFNSPVPDEEFKKAVDELEPFHSYVSTGGNVLGAATYIAKAVMGSNPVVFVGADFCFSYTRQFHPWKSKYDAELGVCLRAIDVYGNSRLTWQSYFNFKTWFDWLCHNITGIWINCTEGGLLGSYTEGNIMAVRQMTLKDFYFMYSVSESFRPSFENPEKAQEIILF